MMNSICFIALLMVFSSGCHAFPLQPFLNTIRRRHATSHQKVTSQTSSPGYETRYFTQYLDHFNLASQPQTWQQRYLINDTFWGKPTKSQSSSSSSCPGPILFYTGNESPVTDYWAGSGFMTDVVAPRLGALLLFAEHRYFGESMPFGVNHSWDYGRINYLSSEQALADYAYFLTTWKRQNNVTDCPVISFGGSYGGMLTAWFRSKYPNVVIGGFAASAPFAFVNTPGMNPYKFMDTCTGTYASAQLGCDTKLHEEFMLIQQGEKTQQGRAALTKKYKLCSTLQDGDDLLGYVTNALVNMAMLDYPYATDYGINLPGWPVNKTCSATLSDGLGAGLEVYWSNNGANTCLNMTRDVPDFDTCCGWDYLACSEIYQPYAQRGIWLPPTVWDVNADIAGCQAQFNVTLRPDWTEVQWMGGYDFASGASNILFSNGLLDPWHTSGVLKSLGPTLQAVVIPEAAHHLDLRMPNAADPSYVVEAREVEFSIMNGWLVEYWNKRKMT